MKYLLFFIGFEYPENIRENNFKVFNSREEAVNSDMFLGLDGEEPIILTEKQKQFFLEHGWVDSEEWSIHLMELPDEIPNGESLRWSQGPAPKADENPQPTRTFNITADKDGFWIEEEIPYD
jgi:hypothetical protein